MRPEILRNIREARDILATKTGVRARLIGDPVEAHDSAFDADSLVPMAREDNLVYFRIASHRGGAGLTRAAAVHVERLRVLVSESLDAILSGQPHVQVRLTFDGYQTDKREVYEIEEIRSWMRVVFLESVPQAIALLDTPTLHVAQATCNPIVRSMKTVGPIGSRARVMFEISEEWVLACYLAGMDAFEVQRRLERPAV